MLNLFDIKIHINFLKIKFVEINNFNYYITEPLVKIFLKQVKIFVFIRRMAIHD